MRRAAATELTPGHWYADRAKAKPGACVYMRYAGEETKETARRFRTFDRVRTIGTSQVFDMQIAPEGNPGYMLSTPQNVYKFVKNWRPFFEIDAADKAHIDRVLDATDENTQTT
jgi:hypothetical protein